MRRRAHQATEEAYQVDANENINALITQYYTAYAAGDVTTLSSIATPISANEQSYHWIIFTVCG